MLRPVLVLVPFLFLGCAAPVSNPVVVGDAPTFSSSELRAAEPAADADPSFLAQTVSGYQAVPPSPPRRPRERFSLKSGYVSSDEDGFDDGFLVNGAWMRPMSEIAATEVEFGYMDASGSHKGVDRDVWAIPVMMNGRINAAVGERLEFYGGLGLGWFYYDAEAKAGSISASGDGFLFGGDAYFGGDILIGEKFRLGLEGKYYATDNASDLGGGLDSYVVLLTLGFDR